MSNSGAACCRRSLQNTFDFLLVLSSSFDKILFPRWLGSAGGSQVFIWCCSEVPLMFILLTKILWILHVVLPWYTGLQLTLHQWELPSFHMDHFHDFTSYSFLSLYDIITWLLKHLNWCICLCHFSITFKLSVWNISDCLSSNILCFFFAFTRFWWVLLDLPTTNNTGAFRRKASLSILVLHLLSWDGFFCLKTEMLWSTSSKHSSSPSWFSTSNKELYSLWKSNMNLKIIFLLQLEDFFLRLIRMSQIPRLSWFWFSLNNSYWFCFIVTICSYDLFLQASANWHSKKTLWTFS